jgi:subfamily B ATP-binding cassette protein MsbA
MGDSINKKKGARTGIKIYRRLLGYMFPFKGLFFISVIGYLIYAGTQPLIAALIKYAIDALQTEAREGAKILPLFVVGLFAVRGFGAFFGNYFLARVSANVVHVLRCELFAQYTCLPTSYFDQNNSGYMISRLTHNVGEVAKAITDAVRTFVREGLTAVGLLGYLFYLNWQLSLIFLGVAPLIALLVSFVSKRLRRFSKNIQESVGDMTHIASELVGGHRIVKSFGGEEYERCRFFDSSQYNKKQSIKLAVTLAIQNPVLQIVISFALAGIMYLALMVMVDASAGEFVAYLSAAFMLPRPIKLLSDVNSDIQKGIVAADSLFEILDEPEEKDKGDYEVQRAAGRLEFKNVSFRYPEANKNALDDINFTIEAGQTVALVGASGGGKSTLVSLISRFYDHDYGVILLDGVEISLYKLPELRRQIALVTQHITLFNDTVANNIAYGGMEGASRGSIERAALDAHAMEFVSELPYGLDTEIGEHGTKLSGGQRQRLALARAILKDAPILILDEATSALDTESERLIQAALNTIMQDRTTLVIAHRLSTIERADVIIVVEHGKIIEQGSHQELIVKNGAYSRLHQVQFGAKDAERSIQSASKVTVDRS